LINESVIKPPSEGREADWGNIPHLQVSDESFCTAIFIGLILDIARGKETTKASDVPASGRRKNSENQEEKMVTIRLAVPVVIAATILLTTSNAVPTSALDWDTCHDELDRTRRLSSDASDTAEEAQLSARR
jgi:hypothetical protein